MEGEINLVDYWRVLVKRKMAMAIIVCTITFSSAIYALALPNIYKAEATIMPFGGQKGGGLASLAIAQMGLGGMLGAGASSSTATQLMAILQSRTLAEKIIEKYGLMEVFFHTEGVSHKNEDTELKTKKRPSMEDAVNAFFGQVTFRENLKSQLIIVTAIMKDPTLAARLVNGYLEELVVYINNNTFTTAKRNRIFVEKQLERSKAELLESGKELAMFYANNGISNVVPTVDVDVSLGLREDGQEAPAVPANSKAWVDAKEKTDELLKQVVNVKAELEKARFVRAVPQQVYLQYITLQRELLAQINTSLTQQYEMAKIEEIKEDIHFQVIDWARVPGRKFKPLRKQIVQTAFIVSLFLSVFYTFLREYLEKLK